MPVIWDAVALIMTSEMDNSISLQKLWIGHTVRTFAQILMIGEFYGICQSVIEFVNWTQIINSNWNTSRVGLCKDARVHSLIHKYMREGYMWMLRYMISYELRQENKVVLWEVICS